MRKLLKYILILLLVIVAKQSGYGQKSKLDSLLNIVQNPSDDTIELKGYINLGLELAETDYQQALFYFHKALNLADKVGNVQYTAELFNELGGAYQTQGYYDSSIFYFNKTIDVVKNEEESFLLLDAWQGLALNSLRQSKTDSARHYLLKALRIAEELSDFSSIAGIHVDMGNIFLEENDRVQALEQFILAAKLQDSLVHNPIGQCTALSNIGNIQYTLGNLDKALMYAMEARVFANKGSYEKGIAYTSQLLGRIYRQQKKPDEALSEYNNALEIYQSMGERRSASEILSSIGNIFYDLGEYTKAKSYYIRSLQLAKEIPAPSLISFYYSSIGYANYALRDYDKAIIYIDSSLITSIRLSDSYSVMDALHMLSNIHKEKGNYKEALEYYRQFSSLKDSLSEAENRSKAEEIENKYQNDKKVAEIKILKADQSIKEATLKSQKTTQMATGVALLFVVLLAIILVNRYRVVNRVKRMIEMERVRNTIARDLHDDLGSTLSSINIISKMALNGDNESVKNHLQRIEEHTSKMMDSMGDIVWSINPQNDSADKLLLKMHEFAEEILEPKNITYVFNEEISLPSLILNAEVRKNIFLIYKEAVNNSAKHSGAQEVKLSISAKDDFLFISICDNGKGYDMTLEGSGNGLKNMKERARSIHGELDIASNLNDGTCVHLKVPLTSSRY